MAEREPPKTTAEMFAEFVREVGTLYLIFGVLDAQILKMEGKALPPRWFIDTVEGSLLLLGLGIVLERLRDPEWILLRLARRVFGGEE